MRWKIHSLILFLSGMFVALSLLIARYDIVSGFFFFALGLILFIDGYSEMFRRLSAPKMKEIIRSWPGFEDQLNRASSSITNMGYKPAAVFRPGTVHAFAIHDGRRERLYGKGERIFTANNANIPVTRFSSDSDDDLPGKFTHDVVSRPVLIDAALPVIGHVLGPNELGYFIQLSEYIRAS